MMRHMPFLLTSVLVAAGCAPKEDTSELGGSPGNLVTVEMTHGVVLRPIKKLTIDAHRFRYLGPVKGSGGVYCQKKYSQRELHLRGQSLLKTRLFRESPVKAGRNPQDDGWYYFKVTMQDNSTITRALLHSDRSKYPAVSKWIDDVIREAREGGWHKLQEPAKKQR